jgi:hypothetical protein
MPLPDASGWKTQCSFAEWDASGTAAAEAAVCKVPAEPACTAEPRAPVSLRESDVFRAAEGSDVQTQLRLAYLKLLTGSSLPSETTWNEVMSGLHDDMVRKYAAGEPASRTRDEEREYIASREVGAAKPERPGPTFEGERIDPQAWP